MQIIKIIILVATVYIPFYIITPSITGRETAAKRSEAAVSRSGFMQWLALLDFVEQVVKFYTEVRQLI